MKFSPIFIALCFICLSLSAQSDYTQGYLVLKNGDTVKSWLQPDDPKKILSGFRAKKGSPDAQAEILSPAEVNFIQYTGGNRYASISFVNSSGDSTFSETLFARTLVKGDYNLYSFYRKDRLFFVVIDQLSSYLLYDNFIAGFGSLREDGNYYAQITQYATNCKTANLQPGKVEYTESDMTDFFRRLNQCVNPHTESASFYQKTPEKVQLMVYAGGMQTTDRTNYTGEFLAKFNNPKIHKNFYFVTGLMFNYLKEKQSRQITNYTTSQYTVSDKIIGLPIALRYNLLNGIIQPYVLIGGGGFYVSEKNTDPYTPNPQTRNFIDIKFFAGAGVEGYITPWLAVKAGWWVGLYNQLPTVGLAVQF